MDCFITMKFKGATNFFSYESLARVLGLIHLEPKETNYYVSIPSELTAKMENLNISDHFQLLL